MLAFFIYAIPDRDWDLARKIQIESYLLNEVLNSNIDEEKVKEAIQEVEEKIYREEATEVIFSEDIVESSESDNGENNTEAEDL